eukprot:2191192-Rhodomonas_salina.2
MLPRERAADVLLAVQPRQLLQPERVDVRARVHAELCVEAHHQHAAPRRVLPYLVLQRPAFGRLGRELVVQGERGVHRGADADDGGEKFGRHVGEHLVADVVGHSVYLEREHQRLWQVGKVPPCPSRHHAGPSRDRMFRECQWVFWRQYHGIWVHILPCLRGFRQEHGEDASCCWTQGKGSEVDDSGRRG